MPAWKDGRYFSFIAVHYIYIISWILIASILLYIPGNIHYVDALLLASGAATQSGQTPVDLNSLRTGQQLVLWAVAMVTNVIFVHSLLVLVRLSFFRKRFRSVVGQAKEARRNGNACDNGGGYGTIGLQMQTKSERTRSKYGNQSGRHDSDQPTPQPINHIAASSAGPRITLDETSQLHPQRRRSSSFQRAISSLPPFTWQASIASYSDWDETQKNELGGTEYRALKTLFFILLGYFVAFHLLGIISLLCVILWYPQYGRVVDDIGAPKGWWAIFTAGSAFNDVGFTLTPNSMVPFNKVPLLLLVMTLLIVIGNTGFPCMLRLIIWVLAKTPDWGSQRREELQFLLDHPRRCFTLLFPSVETWRLLGVLLVLNAVDLAIFILLDTKAHSIQWHTWLINGLFQVASTRTAGFTVTSLTDLHPAVQVSFVVMMYISAFPTTMAMRRTNVYEEKSLGIYEDTPDDGNDTYTNDPPSVRNDLSYHIQKQLSFDLWYIVLGTFLIALTEGDRLQQQHKPEFTLFAVLFEVVSAYGTVGLSLGYAWMDSSLCAQFRGISKLVILAMQIRGRHRGLPYALDQAVLLPYELLRPGPDAEDWEEEEGYDGDDEDDDGWRGWLRRRRSDLSSLLSVTDGENTVSNERERLLP